ncbi:MULTISPECIES: hypothetical protein [Streptomyces]|uniref:hypothetical protein n=1 Tax=Streptomyces TaxID=1883 RepID=UPI00123C4EEB|nr:hypothetical protein [Streptomyces venezuelae]
MPAARPAHGRALTGARLRPGAALPARPAATAQDPAMPAPVHVAVPRAGFGLSQMLRKARKYAPSHIRIVVSDPSGDRPAT